MKRNSTQLNIIRQLKKRYINQTDAIEKNSALKTAKRHVEYQLRTDEEKINCLSDIDDIVEEELKNETLLEFTTKTQMTFNKMYILNWYRTTLNYLSYRIKNTQRKKDAINKLNYLKETADLKVEEYYKAIKAEANRLLTADLEFYKPIEHAEADNVLYYLRISYKNRYYYKIGVTTNSVEERYKGIEGEYKILYEKRLINAKKIESQIKNDFIDDNFKLALLGTSGTEIYDRDILNLDT